MAVEFESTWAGAEAVINENGTALKEAIQRNNFQIGEFTSVAPGENPFDLTCKFRGTRITKMDTLLTKMREAYPDLTQSEVKMLIMAVGIRKRKEAGAKHSAVRTFDSPQAFVRNELVLFHPVDCAVDTWDCDGDIPAAYRPYLSGLSRPWELKNIKGAMLQELDAYNRSLPKDMANSKISKETFDVGFDMALSEYFQQFDERLRKELAYDGSDPRQAIGVIIDSLAITGNRELQIAKIWQYAINVKRVLFPECGIRRRWHVCPTVVGRAKTGKTETILHFLVRPLLGRGTPSRVDRLADSRWTRAFTKYYGIFLDDLGYDDFTDSREGILKQIVTGDKMLDRALGGNTDSSFSNLHLKMSLCSTSNFHVADLTKDDALLRRFVELPSAKTGRGDITKVLHLDPNMVFRSIDESQLEFDPLQTPEVAPLWDIDLAEARQHHWVYRGLRHLGYLPQVIEPHYSLREGNSGPAERLACPVAIETLLTRLKRFHIQEYSSPPRGRMPLIDKLEEVGIVVKTGEDNVKTAILLPPYDE